MKKVKPDDESSPVPLDANAEPWIELVTRWSFAAGIAIFLINMVVAWWVVCSSKQFIATPLSGSEPHPSGKGLSLVSGGAEPVNQLVFASRIAEMNVHLRAMANQQTTVIVGMAAAFSFIAVGFALFVMGIRSAFRFSGQGGPNHRVVLSSTSPGILCFVLSAAIMIFALSRPIAMQLGGITFQPDGAGAPAENTIATTVSGPTNSQSTPKKTLYEPPAE